MRNRLSRNVPKAFALDVVFLSQLCRALQVPPSELKIRVVCADGSMLFVPSLRDLEDLPNPLSRKIETINLDMRGSDGVELEIEFGQSDIFPITYTINGEDEQVVIAHSILETHVEPIYRRWSSISAGPSSAVITPLLMFATFVLVLSTVFGTFKTTHPTLASALGGTMVIVALLSVSVDLIRKYMFPRASFLIGDGRTRYQRSEKLRTTFGLGAIAVAISTGLLVAYISK